MSRPSAGKEGHQERNEKHRAGSTHDGAVMGIDFANCLAGFTVIEEQLSIRTNRGKMIPRMRESHVLHKVGMGADNLSRQSQ